MTTTAIREVLQTLVEYCGGLVTVAASAQEALAKLAQFTPSIVVVDVSMPREDGYWLLTELRKLQSGATLPVIAITAFGKDHRREALAAGFDGFVPKPIRLDDFCEVVKTLARKD